MSIIKCPECGNQVSSNASMCPNCGCPMEVINEVNISKRCVECGQQLPQHVAACPHCGCPVSESNTSAQSQSNSALNSKFKYAELITIFCKVGFISLVATALCHIFEMCYVGHYSLLGDLINYSCVGVVIWGICKYCNSNKKLFQSTIAILISILVVGIGDNWNPFNSIVNTALCIALSVITLVLAIKLFVRYKRDIVKTTVAFVIYSLAFSFVAIIVLFNMFNRGGDYSSYMGMFIERNPFMAGGLLFTFDIPQIIALILIYSDFKKRI